MKRQLFFLAFLLVSVGLFAQTKPDGSQGPVSVETLGFRTVPSLAQQMRDGTFIPAEDYSGQLGKDKKWMGGKVVPGKGYPKAGDPLVAQQKNATTKSLRAPIQNFEASAQVATPSDPTGAAGPSYYIAAWNSAFAIFNKDGSVAVPAAALATLFGTNIGDPIVLYDAPADRYIVTEFDNNPNGFNMAISQGPDPVNDGWYIYSANTFSTGTFPDYTKFSIWSDSYLVTANISGGTGQVFAVDRTKMLVGDNTATIQAFNLPGISTNGFFSPQAFNVGSATLPPPGNATFVYHQDDAFAGIANDHLKLWDLDVDFTTPANSTMSAATIIDVTPFNSVFDGGSFSNLPQPTGPDIDAVQAAIMNQAQYRVFPTYNSVVFNFVVDTATGFGNELAGIRWYELRQTAHGQPWTVYQEGTYVSPSGDNTFLGSMAMDANGHIGLAYSTVSANNSIALRYTGRFDGDALGTMTGQEELIVQSNSDNPNLRYADYAHLTIDPADDETFWHISEYFMGGVRRAQVASFKITPPQPDDVGVSAFISPVDGVLTPTESITIEVRNFGSNDVSGFPVQYTIDGGAPVVETFSGTLPAGQSATFTFAQQADLSAQNATFNLQARTNLTGDSNPANDPLDYQVTNSITVCEPTANSGCNIDGIKQFILGTINVDDGGNGCNTTPGNNQGYVDRRNLSTDLDRSAGNNVYTMQAQQNWTGGPANSQLSAWIDFNDNGTFEASEQLISGQAFQSVAALDPFTLTIPSNSMMGAHILRVKSMDTSAAGDVNNPCSDFDFGEVHDYTVNITDSTIGINDFELAGSDLIVLTKPNNQFEITMTTPFDEILSISVINAAGQIVAFNNLPKDGDAYRYELDMSYAASGVYFIRMGNRVNYQTARIIKK